MKEYEISIEKGCRVLQSRRLLVKAMEALPIDAVITRMQVDDDGGYIKFTSTSYNGDGIYSLHFRVTESVELGIIKY